MREPIECGLSLGALWFGVIPRSAGALEPVCSDPRRLLNEARQLAASLPRADVTAAPLKADAATTEATLRYLGLDRRAGPSVASRSLDTFCWSSISKVLLNSAPPAAEPQRVKTSFLWFLSHGQLVAFGHPDDGPTNPRAQIAADAWVPGRFIIARDWAAFGTKIGDRQRMWRVVIYCAAAAEPLPAAPEVAPPRRGRLEQPYWRRAATFLREKLIEDGVPEPGDGGQARLARDLMAWFEKQAIEPLPGEATIARHVKRAIAARRAELDAPG